MSKIEPKQPWKNEDEEEQEEEQLQKKPEKREQTAYEKVEVTTQTAPAIRNISTDEVKADVFDVLVEILNKISRIEKSVA